MTKIAGLGELLEGVLEKDPLDDTYQIRFSEEGRQHVVRLQDVFAEYAGQEVRFTIGLTKAIRAIAESLGSEGATAAVTFDDLAKGN